jgi:hypothetical protein
VSGWARRRVGNVESVAAPGRLAFTVTNMWALVEGEVALEDFSEEALERMDEMHVSAELSRRRKALKVEHGFGRDQLCIDGTPGCLCVEQWAEEEVPE